MEELDRGNRPLGVSVLAVFALIGGVLALVGGGLVVTGSSTATLYGYGALTGLTAMISGVLVILVGILVVVEGWGMWSGRGWARTFSIILDGLGIVYFLFLVVLGEWLDVVGLVIDLYVLWYLLRPNVKVYFGKGGRTPSPA